MAGYTEVYDAEDVSESVIDSVAIAFQVVAGLGSVVALFLMVLFVKKVILKR